MEKDQKYDARLSPEAVALSRGSLAQQINQQAYESYAMTADQQIRAKALECAVLLWTNYKVESDETPGLRKIFMTDVKEFYHYISEGK